MPNSTPHNKPWKWGQRLRDCLKDLKPDFSAAEPPIVDYELIPNFSGAPEGLFVWLICEREVDVQALQAQQSQWVEHLKGRMAAHGFPPSAIETVQMGSVSLEAIEAGGGRFYYFR